jgi:hypothetical protein
MIEAKARVSFSIPGTEQRRAIRVLDALQQPAHIPAPSDRKNLVFKRMSARNAWH